MPSPNASGSRRTDAPRVWAPAVYTFLAMNWGASGWLVIAGIIVVATIGIHASTRLARRFLEDHGAGACG